MKADRITMTLDAELGAQVRDAAKRAGQSVSAWLAEAVQARLRHESLRAALDAWQEESGAFTQEELDAAAAELGLSQRRQAS
jgi:hypothetical protein